MTLRDYSKDDLARDAADLADQAKTGIKDARDSLSDMADRAHTEALSAGRTISALVMDEIDRRGSALGDGLQHIAETVRDAAAKSGATPQMVAQAVGVIDDVAGRLKSGSVRDVGDRLARFGRENPGTLALAALAAGVLAGRFLIARSSTIRTYDDPDYDDRDRPVIQHDASGSRLETAGSYARP